MNPTSSPADLPDAGDDELLSYLDGELDAEGRRRVEERLTRDPTARQRLQSWQQCDDALAELPRRDAPLDFVHTTVAMVAVSARDDAQAASGELRRRRLPPWIAGVVASLLAATAGYAAAYRGVSAAGERLRTELPVLVQLDELRLAESFDFVRQLADARLFSAESTDEADAIIAATAQDVAALTLPEQDELARRRERLTLLAPAEQERLLSFARELAAAPNYRLLETTLLDYHDWVRDTLSPAEQDALARLVPGERIERIRGLREDQAERDQRQLSNDDLRVVAAWFDELMQRVRPPRPGQAEPQRRAELRRLLENARANKGGAALFNRVRPDDLAKLRESLSPDAREKLPDGDLPAVRRQIGNWLQLALRDGPGPLDEQAMADYLQSLPPDERDRLLRLPVDEMQQQLRRELLAKLRSERAAPPPPEATPERPRRRRPPGASNRPPGTPNRPPRREPPPKAMDREGN